MSNIISALAGTTIQIDPTIMTTLITAISAIVVALISNKKADDGKKMDAVNEKGQSDIAREIDSIKERLESLEKKQGD